MRIILLLRGETKGSDQHSQFFFQKAQTNVPSFLFLRAWKSSIFLPCLVTRAPCIVLQPPDRASLSRLLNLFSTGAPGCSTLPRKVPLLFCASPESQGRECRKDLIRPYCPLYTQDSWEWDRLYLVLLESIRAKSELVGVTVDLRILKSVSPADHWKSKAWFLGV